MKTLKQTFSIRFHYPVLFTHHVFKPSNTTLVSLLKPSNSSISRILLVVDAGLVSAMPDLLSQIERYLRAHHKRLCLVRAPLLVPGGEQAKNNWERVKEILTAASAEHLDRHDYIIAVGGGSVLDMAGFAASIIHRGLRLIRIPTTVLAQNDAGIGVKNSMNGGGAKNFLGTFTPPMAVVNDAEFLKTLPPSEWLSGISEAFKVAIIKDSSFFKYLCQNAMALRARDQAVMEKVIHQTAALHLQHIATSGDPFENGSARPLDFGHWAAHRLELISDFTLGHGQAVAIGIALDSTYAYLKQLITAKEHALILQGLSACGLSVWSPLLTRLGPAGTPELFAGLEQFREHLGGKLCITLPAPIGNSREVHVMDQALIQKAIAILQLHGGVVDALTAPPPSSRHRRRVGARSGAESSTSAQLTALGSPSSKATKPRGNCKT